MKETSRVKTSKWAGAGAAAVGAATTAAVLLLGTATASAADGPRPSNAFGIKVESPVASIPAVPYAEYDGKKVSDELVGTDGSLKAAPFSVRLVTAEADKHSAESSVADLDVAGLLKAKLLRTYCDNGDGGLQILDGSVLGVALPETPAPSQVIPASPLLTLTLNQRDEHADGTTTYTGLTLDLVTAGKDPKAALDEKTQDALPDLAGALHLPKLADAKTIEDLTALLPGAGSTPVLSLTVGSATCGRADEEKSAEPVRIPDAATGHPEAPKPAVTEYHLPVTG
jgi:hypothetical protein